MQTTQESRVPSCFGREWDSRAVECTGGPDVGYTHPKTGEHVREACGYYADCGHRTQVRQQQMIPAQQLVRPVVNPQQPTQLPSSGVPPLVREYMAQQLQQQNQTAQQAAQRVAQQQVVASAPPPQYPYPQPPVAAGGPLHHPAPSYQLNYMMPPYLTVPEHRPPNTSVWGVLGREMVRAMGKSLGHTISHFFDINPFRSKP